MKKTLKFAKIKCKCGHVTLIPAIEAFHVFESIKCEKCGKLLAEPKNKIRIWSQEESNSNGIFAETRKIKTSFEDHE